MTLALVIGMPLAALLVQNKVIDPCGAIPTTLWIGSLVAVARIGYSTAWPTRSR